MKENGWSINLDIHHSKVFSSEQRFFEEEIEKCSDFKVNLILIQHQKRT